MMFKKLLLLSALLTSLAVQAATWEQQPGEYYWYKSGTANKYDLVNPTDHTIPKTWVKQNDKVYIQCKSSGGSLRYYEKGTDCNTGKPKVVKCEAFMCKDDFGITFDLTKNTVVACPRVTITKEQMALIYDGLKANNVPPCK